MSDWTRFVGIIAKVSTCTHINITLSWLKTSRMVRLLRSWYVIKRNNTPVLRINTYRRAFVAALFSSISTQAYICSVVDDHGAL